MKVSIYGTWRQAIWLSAKLAGLSWIQGVCCWLVSFSTCSSHGHSQVKQDIVELHPFLLNSPYFKHVKAIRKHCASDYSTERKYRAPIKQIRPVKVKKDIIYSWLLISLIYNHSIRSVGSAAISMVNVASGKVDAYYEMGMHAWDIAAGDLIVREAGGVVMDTGGNFRFTVCTGRYMRYVCWKCV